MNKTSEITVSERLGQFLKQMNMNAFSLSKKIGGTSQKYYKILSGQSNPQYETIQSILDAFPELSVMQLRICPLAVGGNPKKWQVWKNSIRPILNTGNQ